MKESNIFRCVNSSSNKWWAYEATDTTITTTWGKVVNNKNYHSNGNTSVQSFPSNQECNKFLKRIVSAKLKKGYIKFKDDSVEPAPKKEKVKQTSLALDLW